MNENIKVLELSSYSAPEIKEDKRNEWVNYGEENDYFNFLIDRYRNSTTNNSIINNITRLVYGYGVGALNGNRKPNEYAQFVSMFDKSDVRKMVLELKMLGQCAIQVHYSKDRKTIKKFFHIPVQLLRPEKCNKDGEIEAYYYSDDWSDVKTYVPTRLDAFGFGSKDIEILYVQPYSVGMKYFSNVDYLGGIPYSVLEEEVSDYLINLVQTGFSAQKLINFNNGAGTPEQQSEIYRSVTNKLTGSKGAKLIVSFNDDKDSATTIDDIPLNDAPEHYQYLSEECMRKIMLSHNVTSPLLFGIASTNGFSSNADELKNSFILFDNMVIRPMQELLLDAFDKILSYNNISLDLYFQTLKPLEFNDRGVKDKNTEDIELSKEFDIDEIEVEKYGEDINLDEWELIYSEDVDYDTELEIDDKIKELNTKKESLLSKVINFATTGTARPNSKSAQDGEKFKSRYRYSGEVSENSREFCKKMLKANKLYRKEDIEQMSKNPKVNGEWSEKGKNTYDLFLFKGGGACRHVWKREIYAKKSDVNNPNAKEFTPAQTRKAGEIAPKNDKRVYQKPNDMPNNGFLNR